jgi:hypothetical protein
MVIKMETNKVMQRYIFFILFFLFGYSALAQEINISLGPDEIALNDAFTITITVKNDKLRSYSNFPEIPGFLKRGTSSSSSTSIINGQVSSENSITQTYAAQREGTFTLDPFEMTINGETIKSAGKTITVGPPRQHSRSRQRYQYSPFDDIFGDEPRDEQEEEFIEIADNAFLGLTIDKNEVYTGEGFTTTLALYIADDNRAPLSFHDLGNQLGQIVKKLKPENCWEENFEIVNVQREDVKIGGRPYAQYKLYQARYYPLNTEPVRFPSVGLKMIKYKVAKRPSFFGRRQQEDFKTYYTQPKTVKVKELPPHPLSDKVAVGDYQLRENISSKNVETGNSFSYTFNIMGQGNISAISEPPIEGDELLTIYDPNVSQNTRKEGGTVIGNKQFNYYAIPNEPGEYQLSEYFNWIYFNPRLDNYDTLRSKISINVSGESKKNENIMAKDPGAFYNRINQESNSLQSLQDEGSLTLFVNIFILLMLAATAFIIFKK